MSPRDTIFALATPATPSVAALVRVSGPACSAAWKTLTGRAWQRGTARATLPLPAGDVAGLLLASPGPRSFTGEDTLEVLLPGNLALVQQLEKWLAALPCRRAEPGEFTRRALQNGRINVSQATATLALVNAQSEADRRRAMAELSGHAAKQVAGLAERLRRIAARHEMLFDFAEEEHAEAAEELIVADLTGLAAALADFCGDTTARVPRAEPLIALFGPPNAGKSSLFNALLGATRALVSPLPGTTRDAVSATVIVEGHAATLLDLSGVGAGDSDQGRFAPQTRAQALRADVLLVLAAPGQLREAVTQFELLRVHDADLPGRSLFVDTMTDLQTPSALHVPFARVSISVASGAGLETLRAELATRLRRAAMGGSFSLMHERAAEAAAVLRAALADHAMPAEARAREVRHALTLMDQGLLAEAPGEVLDYIFGQFCIGK